MSVILLRLNEKFLNSGRLKGLLLGVFAIVFVLEFLTPPAFVFGYLYIGAILLSSRFCSRKMRLWVTLLACGLTLLNLIVPGRVVLNAATVANRLIAVFALLVTGWLSEQSRQYQEKLSQQQAKLQAQEQLSRMREDFVSTLSHDLKTPLLGGIETIKSFEQGLFGTVSLSQLKVLQVMARSQQMSLQLVETLLDVYRNDAEGIKLNQEPVNLVTIAEEMIASLTETARSRDVYIRLSYGDSDFRRLLWVSGDALQLKRVFANLLTNGINHSRRGGKVEVVMESLVGFQSVKVLDEGLGITDSELPFLFERFYQGDSNRHAKGWGLGLYLTRQIIEAHGGLIWAENRRPQGAIFAFKLPALPS